MAFYASLFVFAYTSIALVLISLRAGYNLWLKVRGRSHEVVNWNVVSGIAVVWFASGLLMVSS